MQRYQNGLPLLFLQLKKRQKALVSSYSQTDMLENLQVQLHISRFRKPFSI